MPLFKFFWYTWYYWRMKKIDIHIVGLGNLGSAFLNGLNDLDTNIYLYEDSNVVRQSMQKSYSITPEEYLTAINDGVLLLCIKPQNINQFLAFIFGI